MADKVTDLDYTHKTEGTLPRLIGYISSHTGDIYEEVYAGVTPLGLDVECVGGGRILHEPDEKKIFVYGYSQVCSVHLNSN